LNGDSRRRQVEASERFALENGLEFAADAQLEDIGISAFKGANVTNGALGRFVAAVRANRVSPGSVLIVESLDRLSRQSILKALSLFMEILAANVKIATLIDGRIYDGEKSDFADIVYSLAIMSRAHEESQTKSYRLGEVWKKKRAYAQAKVLTSRAPAWLVLGPRGFSPIPERVDTVKRIYDLMEAGLGRFAIAKRFNEEGVPTFGKSRGWQTSYISKILQNRAVVGEFQAHRKLAGKRVPVGDPVENYFPAIIRSDLFDRAQAIRTQRQSIKGGRKGEGIANLFTGFLRCIYCEQPVHFISKAPRFGRSFIACDGGRRGLSCTSSRWAYSDFETSFLTFVGELDVRRILGNEHSNMERAELAQAVLEGVVAVDQARRRYDRAYDLALDSEEPTALAQEKLVAIAKLASDADTALAAAKMNLERLDASRHRFEEGKEKIRSLVGALQAGLLHDRYVARSKVASHLATLVKTISIAPEGLTPFVAKQLKSLPVLPLDNGFDVAEVRHRLERDLELPRIRRRFFCVQFKDGTYRTVYPSSHDPSEAAEQILRSADSLIVRSGEFRSSHPLTQTGLADDIPAWG
jgi:DNA invertase Pin-like site-specific DNA recombinase